MKLFLFRKTRARGDLWEFWCGMCAARIADPDGKLEWAGYCPRCGSGGRSEYIRTFWLEKLLFLHNLQDVYWKNTGYAPAGKKARQAAVLSMMTEKMCK